MLTVDSNNSTHKTSTIKDYYRPVMFYLTCLTQVTSHNIAPMEPYHKSQNLRKIGVYMEKGSNSL